MLESMKKIGFSESEIKIFKHLSSRGKQSVLQLSKNSGVNRSYCYEVLQKLMVRGFVKKSLSNNKVFWEIVPIPIISKNLEKTNKEVISSINSIPTNKVKENFAIQIYEGKKGIISLCEEISESKTKVIGFGAEGQLKNFCPYEYNNIFKKIRKNKIRFELITLKNKIPLVKDLTKFIQFNKEFDSCVEINVHEDKTIIFFWKKPLQAIKIVDLNVANSFRNYHKQLWESQKK